MFKAKTWIYMWVFKSYSYNGSIRKLEITNFAYIEQNRVIIKNITLLVFYYSKDAYMSPELQEKGESFYYKRIFCSLEDLRNRGAEWRKEYNNFPMRPLGWLSPNEFLKKYKSQGESLLTV